MTALDERPVNGNPTPPPPTGQPIDPPPAQPPTPAANPKPASAEDERVRKLRERLDNRIRERDLSHQLHDVDSDSVFDEVRSEAEQARDREVAEKIRAKERNERLRTGTANVRDSRRQRVQQQWQARAERARDRIVNPDRALATDHRRWVASTAALFVLLAGGVAFMSHTVKLGLVGESGTWLAYLVEPLASVLLIVSLVAQFTARQRDLDVPRGAVWFDVALAVASVLLNTVPWGLRYGFDAGSLTAHLLVPALVVAAVIGWHLAARVYGDAIATSRQDTNTELVNRLALLRQATKAGELPVDVSATQVIKYLRTSLPTGIGHDAARRTARSFLGY